jgi:hypothetical protein
MPLPPCLEKVREAVLEMDIRCFYSETDYFVL